MVLDTRLRMPPRARMLSLSGETLIVCGEAAPAETEAELRAMALKYCACHSSADASNCRVDAGAGARGINEVLIESGATLAGSALLAGVVDVLIVYPPRICSGTRHVAWSICRVWSGLASACSLRSSMRRVGADPRIDLAPLLRSENA